MRSWLFLCSSSSGNWRIYSYRQKCEDQEKGEHLQHQRGLC